MSDGPIRVLFLCTGNSCRSQMAEALARQVGEGRIEAFSAGTDPRPVHPMAVQVMAESGIDILGQKSKAIDSFLNEQVDFVITTCDRARERCPTWPGAREQIHWSFDDPSEASGTTEHQLAVFRRVRNEIKRRLDLFTIINFQVPRSGSGGAAGTPAS